jgi:ribosomal subunit interface protein
MAFELRVRNGEITLELREHVERRLGFALGRFGGRVGRVTVSLEDLNGPRGGLDQHCRIEVGLVPSGKVMAEATGVEVIAAVNRAAERIARRVRNDLERRRVTRRRCSTGRPGRPEA